MTVIKIIFVLLILMPVAVVIMFIISNLTDETLKESERAAKAAEEFRKPKYDRYGNRVHSYAEKKNISFAEKRSRRKERKKRRNSKNREGAKE